MNDTRICGPLMSMWPRVVFDATGIDTNNGRKRMLARTIDSLKQSGVYILWRNDIPYYIGQAKKLRSRLWQHAMNPNDRYYNFWNFFSAFVIPNQGCRDQVETILIRAMPTANSAKPKMQRHRLPTNVIRLLRDIRRERARIPTT